MCNVLVNNPTHQWPTSYKCKLNTNISWPPDVQGIGDVPLD